MLREDCSKAMALPLNWIELIVSRGELDPKSSRPAIVAVEPTLLALTVMPPPEPSNKEPPPATPAPAAVPVEGAIMPAVVLMVGLVMPPLLLITTLLKVVGPARLTVLLPFTVSKLVGSMPPDAPLMVRVPPFTVSPPAGITVAPAAALAMVVP